MKMEILPPIKVDIICKISRVMPATYGFLLHVIYMELLFSFLGDYNCNVSTQREMV